MLVILIIQNILGFLYQMKKISKQANDNDGSEDSNNFFIESDKEK